MTTEIQRLLDAIERRAQLLKVLRAELADHEREQDADCAALRAEWERLAKEKARG